MDHPLRGPCARMWRQCVDEERLLAEWTLLRGAAQRARLEDAFRTEARLPCVALGCPCVDDTERYLQTLQTLLPQKPTNDAEVSDQPLDEDRRSLGATDRPPRRRISALQVPVGVDGTLWAQLGPADRKWALGDA